MAGLNQAVMIAAKAHRGQMDKSGKPYILHPIAVMNAMERDGFVEDVLCVAVLHDVVEDTNVTIQDLEFEGFQPRVIQGVIAMTRRGDETYKQYIERCLQDPIGLAVKYYDCRHNVSRRHGLEKNFLIFLDKRYGGTIRKIDEIMIERNFDWGDLVLQEVS